MLLLYAGQTSDASPLLLSFAIQDIGERLVAPELVDILKDSQVASEVRQQIAWVLGQLGERSVIPNLVAMKPFWLLKKVSPSSFRQSLSEFTRSNTPGPMWGFGQRMV